MKERDINDPDYMPVCGICGNPMKIRETGVAGYFEFHCCGYQRMFECDSDAERALRNLRKYYSQHPQDDSPVVD